MKKFLLILLITFGFQNNVAMASFGCEFQNIQVKWRYDNMHVKLDGFRLYNEGSWVCETEDPLARNMSCEVYLTPPAMTFWLSAFEKGGVESLNSEPFIITLDSVEAALSADVATGPVPLTVNFDASASRSCQGTIESYFWDFGDGETGMGEFTTHLYLQSGTFYPTLYVTDSQGETAQLSQPIVVTDPSDGNEAPTAKITANLNSGFAPLTVNLDANASSDPDGELVGYEWNFGDGGFSSENPTTHIFHDPGEYMVSLTVTDNYGATGEDEVWISVAQPVQYTEAKVNFQPAGAETPEGFLPDSGAAFSNQIGYGWVDPYTHLQTRDRNSSLSTDQSFDTLIFPVDSSVWEMGIVNGDYWITVTVGDPSYPETSNSIQVEGVVLLENEQLSKEKRWVEKTAPVSIQDGRLTIKFEGSNPHSQLCRILIGTLPPSEASLTTEPPVALINAKMSSQSPFLIYLSAESSYDPDGDIREYIWNFGDGETGQGQNLTHEFPMESQFTVALEIKDDSGDTAQAESILAIRKDKIHSRLFVNFQPLAADTPEGFSPDSGEKFSNGKGYGWSQGPFGEGTRDRNNSNSLDQSYDTLILVGPSAVWEAEVPNGSYQVTLCAGDANYPIAIQNIQVEGMPVFENVPLSTQTRWIKAGREVVVDDGTLTVTFAGSDPFAQLCWLSILPTNHDDSNIHPTPVLNANINSGAPLWASVSAANSSDIDGNIVDYHWDFGDGATSSEVSADHLYLENGIYPITLKITDDQGGFEQSRVWVAIPEAQHNEFAINFQPPDAQVPENHLVDSGGVFDDTKGYGWKNISSNMQRRDRNSSRSIDQKHDTLVFAPPDAVWEAVVPTGLYRITICIGDAEYPGSLNNIQVENIPFIVDEQLGSKNRWVEISGWVQVKDGHLTIEFTGSSPYSQLCWLTVEN